MPPPGSRKSYLLPIQLKGWRDSLNLTQAQAADLLGIALRTYLYLESGENPISKAIALSCIVISEFKTSYYEEIREELTELIQDHFD